MKTKDITVIFLLAIFLDFTACKQKQTTEIRNDFKTYYDKYELDGSFVLYDQNQDKFIFYNPEQLKQQFTPASTFKICNSLIGLEAGVIKDEDFVIPWDSNLYSNPNWNKDHSLGTAFKNSTVWYYREPARRVGAEKMKYWLDKVSYGNKDMSGGVDMFWLKGGLLISPEQQIDFLKKLHDNKLPFSPKTMEIVKNIMVERDTLDYIIRAKTGWGDEENRYIGWYVGYIEKNHNVYYFANCIQTKGLNEEYITIARKEIVYKILNDLDLIKE